MRLLLQEFTDVSRPFALARARLVGDEGWFAPFATAAEEDGRDLYLRLGPTWASGLAARKVRVTLGAPHERGEALDGGGKEHHVEDLRADVGADAGDLERGLGGGGTVELGSGLERYAELVFLEAGGDVVVRAGGDVGIDAKGDGGALAEGGGASGERSG